MYTYTIRQKKVIRCTKKETLEYGRKMGKREKRESERVGEIAQKIVIATLNTMIARVICMYACTQNMCSPHSIATTVRFWYFMGISETIPLELH